MEAGSAIAKLERAEEHLHALDGELVALREVHRYTVTHKTEVDGREHVWRIRGIKPLPVRLSLIAGDCLFNLRAALDHLVWANSYGRDERRWEFPVISERPVSGMAKTDPKHPWVLRKGARKVSGMESAIAAAIEDLQPYHARDDEYDLINTTRRCLGHIHELNIVDKHRRLNVVATQVNDLSTSVLWPDGTVVNFGPLEDGAPLLSVPIGPSEPHVHMKPSFGIGIALGDSPEPGHAPTLLWKCHAAVAEVIRRLAGVEVPRAALPNDTFTDLYT